MDIVQKLLKERGIDDAEATLARAEAEGRMGFVDSDQITARGSIHLMLRRVISRDDVEKRLADSKYL